MWPLDNTGRIKADAPKVEGHRMQVQDISWCPHNENVIASASEDCHEKLWQIPDEGLTGAMSEPIVDLVQHTRGVRMISWPPSAQNILKSGGSDCQVIIWNVGTGEALNVFSLPEIMYHGGWNWNGSEVLFTCKDKKLRICDPRKGEVKEEWFGKTVIRSNERLSYQDARGKRAVGYVNERIYSAEARTNSIRGDAGRIGANSLSNARGL